MKDKRIFRNRLVQVILALGVLLTVCTTASVLWLLIRESFQFFGEVSIVEFLTGTSWEPLIEPKTFGILPLVSGTMMVAVGAMVFAVPVGVLVAVYLTEYASEPVRQILKPVLEILAGIPTVVYGYFALTFVTPLLQKIFPGLQVFNALSAAFVVGVMVIPTISSLSDDALKSLPKSLKEGGYALGATSFEVVRDVLLPAASGRILAAVLLAFSRAVGETMAVTLAAGSTPRLEWNFAESIQTMTAFIVQVSMGDTPAGGIEYLSAFAVGTAVFILTMVMNGVGSYIIVKASKELV